MIYDQVNFDWITPTQGYYAGNQEVVDNFGDDKKLNLSLNIARDEVQQAMRLLLRLRLEYTRLRHIKRAVENVTEIYKGVAIRRTCWNTDRKGHERFEFETVGHYDKWRKARIYRNAHNNKTWGLEVSIKEQMMGMDSTHMGANFKTFKEVETMALDWLADSGKSRY